MNKHETLTLTMFGGAGQIGMNLCAYKYKGKYLIVDIGIGFDTTLPAQNKIVVPNIELLEKNKQDIVGILITHGHDDHIAAIPHIWHKIGCPIYATPFPAELINKKTDQEIIRQNIHIISQGEWHKLGPFGFQFISITHSIPESSAIAIDADGQLIVHTGDWKLDPNPVIGKVTDEETLKKLGNEGVLALVCDSTNILEYGGPSESRSEASITDDLYKLVSEAHGKRVFLSCISTNLARMKTCYEIARACGRKLCLVGRSLLRVYEAAEATGYWKQEDHILLDEEGAQAPIGSILYMCTGSQGEPGSSVERIARDDHHCVRAEAGDILIFSARTIIGNEKAVGCIVNNLARKRVKVVFPTDEHHIHVSGHPYREDVATMYKWLKPKFVIPTHGEPQHLIEHLAFAKSNGLQGYYVENGQEISISSTGIKKIHEFTPGRSLVDGNVLLDVDGDAINERKKLQNGIITIIISGHNIKIDSLGLQDNSQAIDKEIHSIVQNRLEYITSAKDLQYHQTINDIIQTITRWFRDRQGQKPVIRVHIFGRHHRKKNIEQAESKVANGYINKPS